MSGLLFLTGGAPAVSLVDPATSEDAQPSAEAGSWTLALSEEFGGNLTEVGNAGVRFRPDGPTWATRYPDWLAILGQNPHTGLAAEQQFYAREAIAVSDGTCKLTADRLPVADRINPHPGFRYTSANLNLYPAYNETYGFYQARMKLPGGASQFPAMWLWCDPTTDGYHEIDVMECSESDGVILTNVHHPSGNAGQEAVVVGVVSTWHTYGVEWSPTGIRWYTDGALVREDVQSDHQAHGPMFLIFNLAVLTPGSAAFPEKMQVEVDHVRIWTASA